MSYVTFQECCKTFRASVRLGWGKERKGEGMGGEKKNQMFPYIMVLAVCDKKLLQLRYKPDVWAKHSADTTGIY